MLYSFSNNICINPILWRLIKTYINTHPSFQVKRVLRNMEKVVTLEKRQEQKLKTSRALQLMAMCMSWRLQELFSSCTWPCEGLALSTRERVLMLLPPVQLFLLLSQRFLFASYSQGGTQSNSHGQGVGGWGGVPFAWKDSTTKWTLR